ncbi:MAG: hypothetical protein LC792_17395 [Actinobacteria bacterium]|nr:hypothetical protein [Actinomycetota bacterium]
MSVEILLVPLALAAAHAVVAVGGAVAAAVGEDGKEHKTCVVQTRLKHPGLLVEALHTVGAKAELHSDGSISGTWEGMGFRFVHHEDGTLSAHFAPDVDVNRAQELILATDTAYAKAVQEAVRQRVRDRAGELGMTVESETVGEDDSVTLVLNAES